MSVKELLRKSSAQFVDASPVLPDGVRVVTREKSASEVLGSLREELEPLDYQVAELHMAGLVHQGDNGEIAKLLKVSPARISAANARIRELLRRVCESIESAPVEGDHERADASAVGQS